MQLESICDSCELRNLVFSGQRSELACAMQHASMHSGRASKRWISASFRTFEKLLFKNYQMVHYGQVAKFKLSL